MVSLLFAVILLHLGLRGHESRLVVLAESPLVVLSLSCNFTKVRTLEFRNATASLRKHRTVPRRAFSDVVSLHERSAAAASKSGLRPHGHDRNPVATFQCG